MVQLISYCLSLSVSSSSSESLFFIFILSHAPFRMFMVYLLMTLISGILVSDSTEIEPLCPRPSASVEGSCSSRVSRWHKQLRIIFFFFLVCPSSCQCVLAQLPLRSEDKKCKKWTPHQEPCRLAGWVALCSVSKGRVTESRPKVKY